MEPQTDLDLPIFDMPFEAPPIPFPTAPTAPTPTPPPSGPTEAEVRAFADAMAAYKKHSGRMFPTWSEILEVLKSLGYVRVRGPRADDRPVRPDERRLMIVRDDEQRPLIARILSQYGGKATGREPDRFFEFPSTEARDEAMTATRRSHGWTSVEPRS